MTAKRREEFLSLLADGHTVTHAARMVDISRTRIYELTKEDPEFGAAFEAAMVEGGEYMEQEALRRAIEGTLRRRMTERNVSCRLEWLPSVTDKATRAQPIIAKAGMGRVFWPKAAWVPELQRQCLVFPAGSPDDGVDALSIIGRLADMLGGAVQQPKANPMPSVVPMAQRSYSARR